MNRHTGQTMAFLGVLLAVTVAAGQSNPAVLKADIPFPFVVANQTLPAGHYAVSALGEHTIRIANCHKQGAFVLTSRVDGHAPESSGKVVFYRYEGTYFLAQVSGPAYGAGRQLYKSAREISVKLPSGALGGAQRPRPGNMCPRSGEKTAPLPELSGACPSTLEVSTESALLVAVGDANGAAQRERSPA